LFRFGVTGQDEGSAIGRRQMDVNHLEGGEFLQDGAWREPRREGTQPVPQGDLQTVGEKGHENMRLDAIVALAIDGTED
jgi:hypothetical protein